MAPHLPLLTPTPPPEGLPPPPMGQAGAVHEQEGLLLGQGGQEPLPEPPQGAPQLLLPYPLGEAVQGLKGGAGAVWEEPPIDGHRLPVGGPQVGPEEEEGQIEVLAVDPGVAPPAL